MQLRVRRRSGIAARERKRSGRAAHDRRASRLDETRTQRAGRQKSSNRDDDLADLLAGFEIAVRRDDVIEAEGPGDDRLQRAFGEAIENKALAGFEPLRIP